MHRCIWRRFFNSAKGQAQTYYELLGVSRGCTAQEVKLAYFRKARKAHPDTNGSHEEFVRLVKAYETLSCSRQRAHYDATLATPEWTHTENVRDYSSAREDPTADWTKQYQEFYQAERPRRKKRTHRKRDPYEPFVYGWKEEDFELVERGLGFMESIRREFHEAMVFAVQGPRVPEFEQEGLKMMFPWAFEADVRNKDSSHQHILQLVSGRQLLGYVQESAGYRRIEGSVSQESQASERSDEAQELELELLFQGRRVAKGVRRRMVTNPACWEVLVYGMDLNASDPGMCEPEDDGMEFLGKVECENLFMSSASWLASVRSIVNLPKLSSHLPFDNGERKRNELAPKNGRVDVFKVYNKHGEPTHRLVQFRSLGVSQVFYFGGNQKQDDSPGQQQNEYPMPRCEVKVQRAWLPPESLWLFEPRDTCFTCGAWYFETARPNIEEEEALSVVEDLLQRRSVGDTSTLTDQVRFMWSVEQAFARKREELGAIDIRVPVLFAAFSSM